LLAARRAYRRPVGFFAMTRMEEEAGQLGADGILGVRLDIGRYEWGLNMTEFIVIGTAVKLMRAFFTELPTAGHSMATCPGTNSGRCGERASA
jgi:Putative heavy-metal-binding